MGRLYGYLLRGAKYILYKRYGFERWHVTSLDQRKYASDIIKYGNERPLRNAGVEIGCGLGDIIRNLHYKNRVGLDIDEKVLEGARFINKITGGNKIRFGVFNFPDDKLQGSFDLVIMVNWIHSIDPDTLKSQLHQIFSSNLDKDGELIIDIVHHEGYPYGHDVEFLTNGLNCTLLKIGEYIRNRQVWAIKKH